MMPSPTVLYLRSFLHRFLCIVLSTFMYIRPIYFMIVFCCVLPASNKARDDDDAVLSPVREGHGQLVLKRMYGEGKSSEKPADPS